MQINSPTEEIFASFIIEGVFSKDFKQPDSLL